MRTDQPLRSRLKRLPAGLCLLLLASCLSPADKSGREILYVTNSAGDDVTVIDALTNKVIGSIETGPTPHGLEASPDGSIIYVSGETDDDIVAVSTETSRVLWRVKVGDRPNHIAISADGRFVYAPIRSGHTADVVDTERRENIKSIPVGYHPHNAYRAPNGKWIYVTSMKEDKITIVDVETQDAIGSIPVGGEPRPAAITNDNRWMYVALTGLHGFVVVDIDKRQVVDRIELPPADVDDVSTYGYTPTHGLGLRPDNRQFWITDVFGGAVEVFSVPEHKLLGRVSVGPAPNWMAFSEDGRRLYVSNSGSDDVSVIDTERIQETARIPVGRAPKRLLAVRVPRGMSGPQDQGWIEAARRTSNTDYYLRGGGTLSCETDSWHDLFARGELDLEKAPGFYRRLGIRGMSVSTRLLPLGDDAYLDSIRQAAESAQRQIAAVSLHLPLLDLPPDQAIAAIRTAGRLRAPVVTVPLGADADSAGRRRTIQAMRRLLPVAQESGVRLALHHGVGANAEAMLQLVQETDPDWVGVCLDFGAWENADAMYGEIEKLAPHTLHTRIRTRDFDKYGEERSIDYRRAMAPLAASGYSRAVSIDYRGEGDSTKGVSKTRDLMVKRWVGANAPLQGERTSH